MSEGRMIKRMSMIENQISVLRKLAELQNIPYHKRIIKRAADTIESLSAKLAATKSEIETANIEFPEAHYGGDWIPSSHPPKTRKDVLVQYQSGAMGTGWYFEKSKNWWTCKGERPIAWQPLPLEYKGHSEERGDSK